MLTFRRSVVVAATVLLLFFVFFSDPKSISAKDLLHDVELEQKLQKNRQETESAIRELQASTSRADDAQERKIELLEAQRKNLEKQLQQLRRLPPDAGVRTQLAFQFPYDTLNKFPAYIWQTWKQDFDDPNFDERFKYHVRSWDEKNNGFVHEVMSDQTARTLIRYLYMNIPQVIEAYEAMPENILRADFFRYLILLARGGTYSDVDTEALQPIPNWIPDRIDPMKLGLIIGIEADPDRPDWDEWYARRIQFCQWTIQSKPGHPVLREIVAKITETTLQKKKENRLQLPSTKDRGSEVMDWTGPGVWTDSVFGYFNDPVKSGLYYPVTWSNFTGMDQPKAVSDVLVLPITSFSPGIETMGAGGDNDPLAFVKHHFEGSWKPEDERMNSN
ncbi:Hoc1p [Sugiyamaella lignohabitans]|uniref:Hoc1p n=1 Tax=Sugiyamaella lignohabitans TaxID=796027 RepID=A0A161HHY3_9ASCO|nr:Hoc1p [Sugiyamaella lignohabitans]ANB11907.1 Hoc1p [Sugiyamaella lignohabitans]